MPRGDDQARCQASSIGLERGESKGEFWRMVALSTAALPKDKPRYLMGVGYVEEREMPPTPIPACGEWIPRTLPLGCRDCGKDTALPRRGLSPLLGVRVPMLGGGVPGKDQLEVLCHLPYHVCPPPFSYATDLVVCVALGCDMFDCVFPLHGQR